MLACLSALAMAMAVPAVAAGASAPIRFDVYIGSPGACITVLTDANTPTNVRLRSEDGTTKAEGTLASDEIFFCPPNNVSVEIGDRIRADDGSFTRTFIVPNLTVIVNRVTDRVRGMGPAQRTIKVGWAGRFGDVFEQRGVRVGADGTWSLDLPFDVRGGQQVFVDWKTPNGDGVHTDGSAAILIVRLGSARFAGNSAGSFENIDVNIDGDRDGDWSGQSDLRGDFIGRFRRPNGNLIEVAPGDHISAASVASDLDWVVPDVQISGDAQSDIVSGQCAGDLAVVELFRSGHRRGFALIQPDGNDEFEFNFREVGHFFADPANVKPGDRLEVECNLETGDRVLQRSFVP